MNKYLITAIILILSSCYTFAQEKNKEVDSTSTQTNIDSVKTNLKDKGVVIDSKKIKKRRNINPLAPSKAAFYSAVLPGLGQIYNKRYWKVPIVYAAIGTGIYSYKYNNDLYDRFRVAFKRRQAGFLDDEFYNPNGENGNTNANFSDTVLQNKQEDFQEARDLSLVITIALYILNIVDANVDAHLQQFNVSDDLSVDFKPFLNVDPINNNPNYGMGLTINF